MLFDELLEKEIVIENELGKYICTICNKQYTKKGIATHYYYSHTDEGIASKLKISSKLKGKSKKELVKERDELQKEKDEQEKLIIPQKEILNRSEIKDFLKLKYSDNDLSNVGRWVKKKYTNVYNSIILNTNYLKYDCTFSERIFHIINNLTTLKICKNCNNPVTFKSLYYGYYEYCSSRCVQTDEDIIKQKKETCLRKYGVEHQSQTQEFKEKTIKTNLEKFGVEYPAQSKEIIKKTKDIFINKFGVDNPMKVEEIKNNCKESLDKHLIEDPNFKYDIQNKKIETSNKNFGADHFMKTNSEPKKRIIDLQNQKFKITLENLLDKLNLKLMDEKYVDAGYKHTWECTKCNNNFIQIWNTIQQGYLCPICYPRNNGTSLAEKEISNFIKELLNEEQIIENTRSIITPKELDIYIPSKKIAIEFNGLYWHSEEIQNDKNYHLNKTIECKKLGIQLIHIFEDEWIFKKDIVKSRLKQILNKSITKRIHARKCIIKEIDPKIKNEFLEKFHIQGKDSSSIKLGAFHEDELISVMTFSKGSVAKGSYSIKNIWELNRFCSSPDYHIPGIASKLLTHFKRNYEWKEIFSYADRRWSQGNVYYQLGFNLEKETGINYWYIKDFQRRHRFGLRKRVGESKDIPEWVLRHQEGYLRIWDCGNLKFQLTNTKG